MICRLGVNKLLQATFLLWEKLGFHITLNHFYEPIPNIGDLKSELWTNYSELPGIDIGESKQLELLTCFSSHFKSEYDNFPKYKASKSYGYYLMNGNFESVDGEILYCMIRHFKPSKIVEIGSGFSTYLSAEAIRQNIIENKKYDCTLTAIEPYPNDILKHGFPGLNKLIKKKVQDVPLAEFEILDKNDILFIDSSHVLKIGGDVRYEYLEILPRLKRGVIIHIHDIYLPAEYPREMIKNQHKFWTEQYMLQAFLAFNDAFEVIWAGSYMHLKYPIKLIEAIKSYDKCNIWPGSFWMRKIN